MKAKKAPAMKAKAMKAMKAMKKVKKVSKIAKGRGAKAAVLKGKKEKTTSGLTAASLVKNKAGKVVSKKASARGKKIKGFCLCGGKTEQGKKLLAKVRAIYKK